jgi:hypothetical protein
MDYDAILEQVVALLCLRPILGVVKRSLHSPMEPHPFFVQGREALRRQHGA